MVSIKQYMKERKDFNRVKDKVLADSFYKGFHYVIVNRGNSHPCAYVEIQFKNNIFSNKELTEEDEIFFPVHGGITYNKRGLKINEDEILTLGKTIGWDYAHSSDKCLGSEYGEEYTTYEILLEVFNAINYLITGDIEV